MALVTMNVEREHYVVGFTTGQGSFATDGRSMHGPGYPSGLASLALHGRMSLADAVLHVGSLPFGGTDCALPMLYAKAKGLSVDVFVVYTDSETWAGSVHPVQALRAYREATGIAAKLIVVAMLSNGFSIADPGDAGMLDVVGFDAATPAAMSAFASARRE